MAGKTIGVLALQGDYSAHEVFLSDLGLQTRELRTRSDLEKLDGLVLPGGESSAMLRLLEAEHLLGALEEMIVEGLPVLATCAGVILLAKRVIPEQPSFKVLDIDVRRNAYGRQLHSSIEKLSRVKGGPGDVESVFIRAPKILRIGPEVEVLAWREDDPVLVRQDRIIAATFHPELGADPWVHRHFLEIL